MTTNSVVEKMLLRTSKTWRRWGGTAGDQERNGNKKREMNSGTPWKDVGHAVMLLVRAPCSCSLFVLLVRAACLFTLRRMRAYGSWGSPLMEKLLGAVMEKFLPHFVRGANLLLQHFVVVVVVAKHVLEGRIKM